MMATLFKLAINIRERKYWPEAVRGTRGGRGIVDKNVIQSQNYVTAIIFSNEFD